MDSNTNRARGFIVAGAALAAIAVALLLLPSASAQASTGGPDLGGYTWIDSTAAGGPTWSYVNIATNGTTVSPVLGDDTESTLTLPFSFTWYGQATTQVKVSSNGYLCFDVASYCGSITYGLQPPPDPNDPGRFVSAYNQDLHCNSNPTCAYSHSWGPVGSRVFVVMLNAEECYPYPSGCNLNFQYKVFEASGCVEVHYASMTDPSAEMTFAGTEGYNPGGMLTGLTYHYTGGASVGLANKAVRYCQTTAPPPACLPLSQTGAPGPFNLNAAAGTPPYTWSAPGGAPAAGAGSAFTTNYASPGTYTVTVTDSTGTFSNCTVNVVLPGCGYTVNAAATYALVDISATGAPRNLFDDSQESVALPFSFNFCGANYNNVEVSSNGYVCLGFTSCTQFWNSDPNPALPTPNMPSPAIFGYFTDLYPSGCNGYAGSTTCTWTEVQGAPPNRVFLYQMKNLPFCCSDTPTSVSLEIKLFETTNCFEVHYGGGLAPYPGVEDATFSHRTISGYQNPGGASGYTYADQDSPGFTRNNQAWSACPVPPVTAGPNAYTFNEDQPGVALDVLANDSGPAGSTLSVTAVSVPTRGTATFTPTDVTYTPDPHEAGADSFTYTVTSSTGGTATGTVTITINPVNDPPAFVGGADVELAQGAPLQLFADWATQVVPGPAAAADESSQSITFPTVLSSVSNPAIFAAPPALDRTAVSGSIVPDATTGAFGVLQLVPSASTFGTSQVCFRAQDGGGTGPSYNTWGDPATGIDSSLAPGECLQVSVNPCTAVDDVDLYVAYRWWMFNAAAPGVTANDAASPMFPLTLVSTTSDGALTLDTASGAFSYYADEDFVGVDTFQYTILCGNAASRVVNAYIDVRVNQPPVAYFDDGTEAAAPGDSVSFNSCAGAVPYCSYDPDGQITEYFWEFGDGYTSFLPLPSHVFATVGEYQVRLTVRDNVGNTSTYLRTVVVDWPDAAPVGSEGGGAMPPIAYAGDNRTVRTGRDVQLYGSQAGGSDQVAWQWMQVLGTEVELRNATTQYPSFTAPTLPDDSPMDLVFSLRVSEGALTSRPSFVTIQVVTGNGVPVAVAGTTQSATVGSLVTLDGSGSTDPDGDELTYEWEQLPGPGAPAVELSDRTSAEPTFVAPAGSGLLQFRLRVTDGRAASQDIAIVALQPAQALPAPTFTFERIESGGDVRFVAGPGVTRAMWDFGDGGRDEGLDVRHHFEEGTYVVTMTAGDGEAATTHTQSVIVRPVAGQVGPDAAAGMDWMPIALLAAGVLAAGTVVAVVVLRRRQA